MKRLAWNTLTRVTFKTDRDKLSLFLLTAKLLNKQDLDITL